MDKKSLVFLEDEEVRADKYIAEVLEMSRSSIEKLFLQKNIFINGKEAQKRYILKYNDEITVNVPDPVEIDLKPENIPLDIVFEDNDLLVVNKPKGMVVHPAPGHLNGTLCNALLYHCKNSLSGINGELRPGIVHRIDKDTSGLLIVAKNDYSHRFLAEQIKEHSFTREYHAICYGLFKEEHGIINEPIGRHPTKRKQMAVTYKNSKPAKTEYFVLERLKNYTYVKFKLYTGRTHQIRVHSAYLRFPVAGDEVYNTRKKDEALKGQCLHAKKIGFIHPATKEYMEFDSPLPEYFTLFLKKHRNNI